MPPRPRDVVVVGASAGGVEALLALVTGLPAELPAAVLVVLHMPAGGTSALPAILGRASPLPVTAARDRERLRTGHVYVARPDHHLMTLDGRIALSHGPTENGHRPAIDALFRSAAVTHGAAVTGVLLSGVLDDGVAGLSAIARQGGTVVVQDPADALYPGMPEHALRVLSPDHVVAAAEIGLVLGKITAATVEQPASADADLRWENEIARDGVPGKGADDVGAPLNFSCPDCSGVLSDIEDGQRYRCRVGHAWTAEALLTAQDSTLERALWAALRSLEEKAVLAKRMATHARRRGSDSIAMRYDQKAEETEEAADVIRIQLGLSAPDSPQ